MHLPAYGHLSTVPEQLHVRLLPPPFNTLVPIALFATGQTLVVTSTWSLGVTDTFLGDYFGDLDGCSHRGLPIQCALRSDVRQGYDVHCHDSFVVRMAACVGRRH
jgi:hypothetical protein